MNINQRQNRDRKLKKSHYERKKTLKNFKKHEK